MKTQNISIYHYISTRYKTPACSHCRKTCSENTLNACFAQLVCMLTSSCLTGARQSLIRPEPNTVSYVVTPRLQLVKQAEPATQNGHAIPVQRFAQFHPIRKQCLGKPVPATMFRQRGSETMSRQPDSKTMSQQSRSGNHVPGLLDFMQTWNSIILHTIDYQHITQHHRARSAKTIADLAHLNP